MVCDKRKKFHPGIEPQIDTQHVSFARQRALHREYGGCYILVDAGETYFVCPNFIPPFHGQEMITKHLLQFAVFDVEGGENTTTVVSSRVLAKVHS